MDRPSRKGNILLLGGTILLLFLLAEGGIRFLDWWRGQGFFSTYRDQTARIKPIVPYRIFGWQVYQEIDGVPYIVSSHGELYPLQKPEEVIRIVAFGGSTTKQLVDGTHYPSRLQQMLQKHYPNKDIEVINVGEDAYATTHMITLLAFDVISWQPDLVILSENVNDLVAGYFEHNFTPDYSNKYASRAYMPRYEEKLTPLNILFHRSSFYWFVKGKIDMLVDRKASFKGTPRASYGDEPPMSAQNLFRRNLATFVTIAKANSIPVLLASQPFNPRYDLWDFNLNSRKFTNAVYPLYSEHAAHQRKFNEIMREVAKSSGSYFLDNDVVLAGDPLFFIDSVHYTKQGMDVLVSSYYRFFLDNKLIDRLQ